MNTSPLGLTCHRQPKWATVQISLPGSSSVCPKPSASPGNPTSPTAHNPWGKVERVNRLIKQQLTKLSTKLRLSWPSLIPIVLTCLWATPCSPRGLRPFELLYGRPVLLNHLAQTPPLAGNLPYLSLRSFLCSHADNYLPAPISTDPTAPESAPLSPGDWVLLKQLSTKSLEPQRIEPDIVILTTPSAAKLLKHQCWYHLSRLKRAPTHDEWPVQQLGHCTLQFSRISQ